MYSCGHTSLMNIVLYGLRTKKYFLNFIGLVTIDRSNPLSLALFSKTLTPKCKLNFLFNL